MKVGAFLGDHAKTSINALLNTGTMAGPFGQLLANGGLLPRIVPAFCRVAHGRVAGAHATCRQMFDTAAVVMGRRDREWTETHAEFFFRLYEQTETERRQRDPRERTSGGMRRVV